jgi:hypothetical protein
LSAAVLLLLLTLVSGCAVYRSKQAFDNYLKDTYPNSEAWLDAMAKLRAMCGASSAGAKAGDGCAPRYVKLTAMPDTKDWAWETMPGYRTIIQVHEAELRRRGQLKPYVEYMLALSRILAEKADGGEIAPEAMEAAFNAGWKFMFEAAKSEYTLLLSNITEARAEDQKTWQTAGQIALGFAEAANAALSAYAAVQSERAAAAAERAARLAASRPVVVQTLGPPPKLNCMATQQWGYPGARRDFAVTCR